MFSIVKTREREQARQLRREQGASIKEIARRVGVSVSSVSTWVRDIELTAEQHAALQLRNVAYDRQMSGTWKQAAARRAQRLAYQTEGREASRLGEALFVAGCMLYWAEGAKHRNTLRFTNSDPEMVRLFVSQEKRRNKLPYGTCRVSVSRTAIVQAIYGAIQEI